MDHLAELAASIGSDPARVSREARQVAAEARASSDWHRVSRASAVLGRSLRMLGEIDLAERALLDAIAAADTAGDDELAADAHLALAGVLSIAGRWPAAFAHLDDVERLGSTEIRDVAELQRAALCGDAGRIDEAFGILARVIPRLRRQENSLYLARMLANRGGLRVGRGELTGAIADFEEAEVLYRRVDQEFAALQTRHDLGCALATMGDLPKALRLFDEVSARFIELGHDASIPLLSRAEALLVGGLSADALAFSADAVRRLQAEGNHSAAAEALVAVAEAARLEGDYPAAIDAAHRAHEWFATRQSAGWERAAALEATRSQHESGGLDEPGLDRLEALADSMSAAGDVRGEVYARSLAAVAACRRGLIDRADDQGRRAARAARRVRLVQPRLAGHHAIATVRLEQGDLSGARSELRKALDALESSRTLLGAGDAGATVATQARSIMQLACRVATVETAPLRALAWMERARAAGWISQPALPPNDDAAATNFARLRTVAGDLRRAELAGAPTGELRRRQAQLEQSMRAEWLKTTRSAPSIAALPDLTQLNDVIGETEVISIALSGDRLVAVVANRRSAHLCHLGDPRVVLADVERATSAMRGMLVPGVGAAVTAARRTSLAAALAALDDALIKPLRLKSQHIVLVVPVELHALPWAALPSLHHRSFTLAPSVRWWIRAASARPSPPASALVVAGPRLAEADDEARAVARCHRKAKLLSGADATVANVGAALAEHDLAHVVAHGSFRHDNPLWSTIELVDGHLTVYELERLRRVPSTMVLATCDSGVVGGRAGAQLHGLAGTLLNMGATTIVAAIGPLPDSAETRNTMAVLHRDLVNGSAASASLARRRASSDNPLCLTSAALVTLGVG